MQNTGWDNNMSHRTGHGPEDPCSALGSAAEQSCLSKQVPPSAPALWFCSRWLILPKGQSGQGTASECLREACGKVNGHCFQLGMLGALLMHTSCSSVTFWNISARCGFVPKCHEFSFSKYNSMILVDQKSVIFSKDATLPALCIPHRWPKTALTLLSFFPHVYARLMALKGLLGYLTLPPVPHPSEVLIKGKSALACWGRQSAEWGNRYEVPLS